MSSTVLGTTLANIRDRVQAFREDAVGGGRQMINW